MEEEEEVAGAALLLGARPAERADPVEAEIIVMEATGQQADKGAEVASSSATAAGAATKVPVVPSVSFSLGAEEKPPTLKSATARAQGVQEAGGKAAAEGGGGRQRTHRAPALKLNMPPIDPKHFGNGGGGGGGSCNCDPAATSAATNVSSTCGSTTAPVFQNDRVRFFSFSSARRSHQHHPLSLDEEAGGGGGGSRLATAAVTAIPPRVRYLRQNTVGSGTNEATNRREMPQLLTRAISRTYTMTSNASSSIGVDEWKSIFDKLDLESDGRADGHIPLGKFREILEDDPLWVEAVPKEVQEQILGHADQNGDGLIDYEEFIDLVRGTHIGLSSRKRRAVRELLKQTVEFIVPYKYSYQNQYSCSPPPLFMLTMSLLQVAIFAYDGAVMFQEIGYIGLNGPVPYCSHLIYDPNKREQVWRYLTYMFIHSGLFHVTFNILIQLVLGIPLEMVHGWWRVMLVYLSGVLAGSLWTSVLRPTVFLSGASGGVYALITAHLGTVIMNFREMACPWCRILIVLVVALTDIVVYVYDVYVVGHTNPVSYPAHISGAVTGLLVGISALKNLRWEPHERYIWAASTFTFVVLMLVAIVWNVAVPSHFVGLAMDIPCISKKVL